MSANLKEIPMGYYPESTIRWMMAQQATQAAEVADVIPPQPTPASLAIEAVQQAEMTDAPSYTQAA